MSTGEVEKAEEKVEEKTEEEEVGVVLAVAVTVAAATVTGLAGAGFVAGVMAMATVVAGLAEVVKVKEMAVAENLVAGWMALKAGVMKAVAVVVGMAVEVVTMVKTQAEAVKVLEMMAWETCGRLVREDLGVADSVEADLAKEETEAMAGGKAVEGKEAAVVAANSEEAALEWEVKAAVERVIEKMEADSLVG